MHPDGVVATAIQYTLALPTMYALISAHEYVTHKYLMHLEFNWPDTAVELKQIIRQVTGIEKPELPETGHVEHHAETYDDMTLKNDERWRRTPVAKALDHDVWRGTAFNWENFLIVSLTMPVYVLPTYWSMGWSVPETLAIFFPCLLLHMLVWNALHPPMHGLPRVPAHVGPPSFVLADALLESPYGKWIYLNHMGHHVLGGKCNYNVVCPMMDHVLGTYVSPDAWMHQMRPVPEGARVHGQPIAPPGVPRPPRAPLAAEG